MKINKLLILVGIICFVFIATAENKMDNCQVLRMKVDSILNIYDYCNFPLGKSKKNEISSRIKILEDCMDKLDKCEGKPINKSDSVLGMSGKTLNRISALQYVLDSNNCKSFSKKPWDSLCINALKNDVSISEVLYDNSDINKKQIKLYNALSCIMKCFNNPKSQEGYDDAFAALQNSVCKKADMDRCKEIIDSLGRDEDSTIKIKSLTVAQSKILKSFVDWMKKNKTVKDSIIKNMLSEDMLSLLINSVNYNPKILLELAQGLDEEQIKLLIEAINKKIGSKTDKINYVIKFINDMPLEEISPERYSLYQKLMKDIEQYGVTSEVLRILNEASDSASIRLILEGVQEVFKGTKTINENNQFWQKAGSRKICKYYSKSSSIVKQRGEISIKTSEAIDAAFMRHFKSKNDCPDSSILFEIKGTYSLEKNKLYLKCSIFNKELSTYYSEETGTIDTSYGNIDRDLERYLLKIKKRFDNEMASRKIAYLQKKTGAEITIKELGVSFEKPLKATLITRIDEKEYKNVKYICVSPINNLIEANSTYLINQLKEVFPPEIVTQDQPKSRNKIIIDTYLDSSSKIQFVMRIPDENNQEYEIADTLIIFGKQHGNVLDPISWKKAVDALCEHLETKCGQLKRKKVVIYPLPHSPLGHYLPLAFAPAGTPHIIKALWPGLTSNNWGYGLTGLSLFVAQVGGGIAWYYWGSKFNKYANDNTLLIQQKDYNTRFLLGGVYGGYIGILQGLSVVTLAHLDVEEEKIEQRLSIHPIINLNNKECGVALSLNF